MNKREIDEMMSRLPSQETQETLLAKIVIAIMFVMFLLFWLWVPDFEPDCFDQVNNRIECELQAK